MQKLASTITAEATAAADIDSSQTAPPPLPCANCRAVLTGPYCAQCGQHVADYHRSVWRFVAEFFDNWLCWDNKLLRTLEPLFRQPGFLTLEFMAGRRVRYVHPLRLFLFTSAVCLTLLQFSHDHRLETRRRATAKEARDFQWVASDTPAPVLASNHAEDAARRVQAEKPAAPDKQATAPADDLEQRIGRDVESRVARNGGQTEINKAISDSVQQHLSWVALALLPLFGMGLRALYWRRDSFYFTHLVFSLHYHTFLLLFWTAYVYVGVIAAYLPLQSLFEGALKITLVLPLAYLFLALRCIYAEGRVWTFAKAFALGSVHLLAIFIALGVIGAVTFFTRG